MKSLVVEDEFLNRKVLSLLLDPYGPVDVAVSGAEAREALRIALEEGEPYDLICLDIGLPDADGQQLLREIREAEESRGIHPHEAARVFMVTSQGDIENVRRAFANECDGYLVKPVDRDSFETQLREVGLIP